MKKSLLLYLLFIQFQTFSQTQLTKVILSNARKLIENANISRVNKDWNLIAEFKSAASESVQFYPVQIVDLSTSQKLDAVQIDLEIKSGGGNKMTAAALLGGASLATGLNGSNTLMTSGLSSASRMAIEASVNDGIISSWLDKKEVEELITFIEKFIVPNLDVQYKKKSSEFKFVADEITFKFLILEKKHRLTIYLNAYPEYSFWTEVRADKIGELLPVLKAVQNKELKF